MNLNTETSTSNHYEVFLPFLVQSPWNLGTQLKTLLDSSQLQADSCYISAARTTHKTVLLLRSADHTQNTSHVITKLCWNVTSLRLRGIVFTESLPRSGLHNPVVPLLRACIAWRLSTRCMAVRWHVTVYLDFINSDNLSRGESLMTLIMITIKILWKGDQVQTTGILTNRNFILEEIKSTLNSRNACLVSVQSLLSSRLLF
jgi:hypothetical protein